MKSYTRRPKLRMKVGPFRGNQHQEVNDKMSQTTKSFAQDTAEKLGVNKRTVERQIQAAKNLTTEAKDIIRDAGAKITKTDVLKLSRLEPEQQKEAASQFAAKKIRSMNEFHPTPSKSEKPPPSEPAPEPKAPAPLPFPILSGTSITPGERNP